MTSSFDRWENDPFFAAAEEVQESADRMESTYRTWIHAKKDTSSGAQYRARNFKRISLYGFVISVLGFLKE